MDKDPRPDVIVCHRVGTLPAHAITAGSLVTVCNACGADVHAAPATIEAIRRWPEVRALCMECALEEMPADQPLEAMVSAGQAAELLAKGITMRPGEVFEIVKSEGGQLRTADGSRFALYGARPAGTVQDRHGGDSKNVQGRRSKKAVKKAIRRARGKAQQARAQARAAAAPPPATPEEPTARSQAARQPTRSICPSCGAMLAGVRPDGGMALPRIGDFGVCMQCAGILRYALVPVLTSTEDLDELETDVVARDQMRMVQHAIRERLSGANPPTRRRGIIASIEWSQHDDGSWGPLVRTSDGGAMCHAALILCRMIAKFPEDVPEHLRAGAKALVEAFRPDGDGPIDFFYTHQGGGAGPGPRSH